MDFIVTPVVVAIIFTTIYKLFELFVCRKERLTILENQLKTPPPYPGCERTPMPIYQMPHLDLKLPMQWGALRWGCLIAGLGLGLMIGVVAIVVMFGPHNILENYAYRINGSIFSLIIGSSVLLFGGIGLIISHVIEIGNSRKSENLTAD